MADGCPLCSVEESKVVFRDDSVFCLWDRMTQSGPSFLIVTHRHIADWFQATEEEQRAALRALDLGRDLILERHSPDGFNIEINVGEFAGQVGPHLYLLLVPRKHGEPPEPRGGIPHFLYGNGNGPRQKPAGLDTLRGLSADNLLIRGADDPLLPHIRTSLDNAIRADFAVAFLMRSGVALIREHLRDLLDRGGRVRIVTGDYLDATDPDALVELLDLTGDLQLRVFEAETTSFHPKAYLFYDLDGQGSAFVGSSNMSRSALQGGVEWNYRVLHAQADRGFSEIVSAFEALFAHPRTRPVDTKWIEAYRARREQLTTQRAQEVEVEPPSAPPTPHAIQQEALAALKATREEGNQAGLVVLATGLGKTWLAAFDSASEDFGRVLFVAHREEILTQALETFRRIHPQARLGLYTGAEKDMEADLLFASIQTLGRSRHLDQFAPDRFGYVVVDEFHHAAARTYRRLIEHFTPRFMLGLTATPERMDGGDLLALCQENLVFRKDLVAGINSDLLCPFRYFGVPDEVDYSNIPWRSSRFDEEELTAAVATTRRAENALEQFRNRGGHHTLGFCCSQRHADFMADFFLENGVRAVAVHSGPRSAPRASALAMLEKGELDIVFAVDMFNEGLDIPNIDTVLMLRPTESSIIWLQQFGRGLRKAEGKTELKVIDYIGNHRSFLVKVRSLLEPLINQGQSDAEIAAAMRLLEQGRATLPDGCHVTYDLEAIDIIKSLLRTRADDDAIQAFYDDFRERHGIRPTAVEMYHSSYNPRSLRRTHGSWTGFLRTMGDLTEGENEALDSAAEFLDVLETTPMTKSFKMLTLIAMLNRDGLPGSVGIKDLTAEFQRVARRNKILRDDVGDALDDNERLRSLIETNPIAAWTGGRGTRGTIHFRYEHGEFSTVITISPAARGAFQSLVRELVDWRLAEYLDRDKRVATANQFTCKVIHSGGRPILKLPDRESMPNLPAGWTDISANEKPYVANFAKLFVNVVRTDQESEANLLPEILRGWFGSDAGLPGTRCEVSFANNEDNLRMEPQTFQRKSGTAELWRHYMREDIPPLFGLTFNTGSWNQGFVRADGHIFLLVTLEKGALNADHRYEDHFLSPQEFQWQSQNRTKQDSNPGRLIRDHAKKDTKVHLFVRRHKVLGGTAAPFVYCGAVNFKKWEGEQPISVVWRLPEPVPATLRNTLSVPNARS